MTSDEFAKNFYLEKLSFLKSCFEEHPKYPVLLGLDGESSIGNIQQTYKIYDEEGSLISDCGELEASAYEYFHERKYEI